ncbi:MAG: glutaminyl-peptide cyclotransferase [Sphingobacteriaceae bacterium]
MHFGKLYKFIGLGVLVLALNSCDRSKERSVNFISPIEWSTVLSGKTITLKTDAETGTFDSIRYFVDEKFVASRTDTQSVKVPTNSLSFGGRLITAVIYTKSDSIKINTNIQLLPSQAPVKYSYEVVNTFSHDTTSYTQGLEYHDGIFYESDGERGQSSLRKVEVKTGKVLQKTDIPAPYFAEGITVVGDKIIMLTYQESVTFVFDKNLTKIGEFPHKIGTGEGWGLAFDGTHILNTDGSNVVYLLNKDTYQVQNSIEVYDTNGPVNNLNELEYIDGKIYANVYMQDRIVIIDPKTGGVVGELNLQDLAPYKDRIDTGYVLNGIAWDAKGRRLFVTGKKWNKLFEIKIN